MATSGSLLQIVELELVCMISIEYSIHSSRQELTVWGWVWRSAGRSSKPTMDRCGLPPTRPVVPYFILAQFALPGHDEVSVPIKAVTRRTPIRLPLEDLNPFARVPRFEPSTAPSIPVQWEEGFRKNPPKRSKSHVSHTRVHACLLFASPVVSGRRYSRRDRCGTGKRDSRRGRKTDFIT